RLLDPSLATPSRLRELLLKIRTPQELLLSKETFAILIDLLRPQEAKVLATILGQADTHDYYQSLKEVRITSGSRKEKILFDFFELPIVQQENYTKLPATDVASGDYSLFPHQRRAIYEVRRLLQIEPKRVLLHMPTGAGKTRTAMNIISEHLRAHEPTIVVWLAYSEELCEQAISEFQKAWQYLGNREVTVHRYWGGYELNPEQLHDGFVVAGLAKTYSTLKKSLKFINTLGSRSSLVIIDEAHQAVAPTYKLVLDALVIPFPQTALLGLTATPGRTWSDISEDEKLADFFAHRKVTLQIPGYSNPIDFLVSEGYLARIHARSLLYQSGLALTPEDLKQIKEGFEVPEKVLRELAQDEQRNLRIIQEVETLVKSHRRIIVFAATVEHACLLAAVLQARGHIAAAVTGSTPAAERERIISAYRTCDPEPKILCNYGVLTTGFDAPCTSAVVIARPTMSLVLYSQMVGRAIRGVRVGGNAEAEVVTVVDTSLPGFRTLAEAFTNWEDVWSSTNDSKL
ncbi:MAG: DEAD/DEAH box helicase, partial [Acidobacteriota bacterium]|nr:DEAD/DEAH box helicase [Acidobacteriota bacterium]